MSHSKIHVYIIHTAVSLCKRPLLLVYTWPLTSEATALLTPQTPGREGEGVGGYNSPYRGSVTWGGEIGASRGSVSEGEAAKESLFYCIKMPSKIVHYNTVRLLHKIFIYLSFFF